jgi:CRP-like cAMP-binding protein
LPQASENLLDNIPLLSDLTPTELRQLEMQASWRRFRPREQIVDRDSADSDIYFVVEGAVQIVNYSLAGREVAFAELGAGTFFGELSAIDGAPRSASVVAVNRCLLASLTATQFSALLDNHPAIMRRLLVRLTAIIRVNTERIMDVSTLSATHRIYLELIQIAEPFRPKSPDQEWLIKPMPTQTSIAGRTSSTRETVARAMRPLIEAGILARRGRAILVLDMDRLEELAAAMAESQEESW